MLANGFSNSGTHALKKGMELLGLEVEHLHEPHHRATGAKPLKFDGRMVVIYRHPRNVLVSSVRANAEPVTEGALIRMIRTFVRPSVTGPFARVYREYFPWRDDRRCLAVTYEQLVASEQTLFDIAAHCETPYLESAFPNLPGLTRTWSGAPSNWADHWTPAVDEVWTASGVQAVQIEAGY